MTPPRRPGGSRRILLFPFALAVGPIEAHGTVTRLVVPLGLRPTDALGWVERPASPGYDGAVLISGAVGTVAGMATLVLDFTNTRDRGTLLREHAFTAYVYRR